MISWWSASCFIGSGTEITQIKACVPNQIITPEPNSEATAESETDESTSGEAY